MSEIIAKQTDWRSGYEQILDARPLKAPSARLYSP